MLKVIESLLLDALSVVYHDHDPRNDGNIRDDVCFMAKEEGDKGNGFTPSTWLADTGASTHMMNTDEGMFDTEDIDEKVTIGNGKSLAAPKKGKARLTAVQRNGTTKDIVLNDCKFVPGLETNLFSLTKSIDQGFKIGNEGPVLILRKGNVVLKFDRILRTKGGKLCGIDLLPRTKGNKDDIAMPAGDEKKEDTKKKDKKEKTKHWDINRMHNVFNHASEEVLRKTAESYGWKVTGKMETCDACKIANARQKDVPKESHTKSTKPGERIFIDTSSIKEKTMGGSKFWLGCVDDATDMVWTRLLKRKNDTAKEMMVFLRKMKERGTPVKYIRCDNAGENRDLKTKCEQSKDLNDIEFEFTARDSPQFNGKIERKFATLFGRMRALFKAAKLTQKLKNKLWGEAAMTVTDLENLLLSRNHAEPSHREFFKKDIPKAEQMRQFGEMGIVKTSKRIKGKLEDRGIPAMYLGRARDHAGDTHRFLNIDTEMVIISRDVIWLNKVYGDYTGTHKGVQWDSIGLVPSKKSFPIENEAPEAQEQGRAEQEPSARMSTRSRGLKPLEDIPNPNQQVLKTLEKLGGVSWNQEAS